MTKTQAINFAIKKIPQIIPLEEEDVRNLSEQILQSANESPEAIAEGFLNILGHEDLSFEFVIEFNNLLQQKDAPIKEVKSTPADISNVGIQKSVEEKKQKISKQSQINKPVINNGMTISKSLEKSQPKSKIKPVSKDKTKLSKKKTVHALKDIDEVVKMLELERDNENSSSKYACNCQALRHPLFDPVPNCLKCGKIICAREGLNLNNCSYCGTDFIPIEERLKIIELLKKEKEDLLNKNKLSKEEEFRYNEEKKKRNKGFKVSSGMGTNLFNEQDMLFSKLEKENEKRLHDIDEANKNNEEAKNSENNKEILVTSSDSDLTEAQDRLDRLLHFQDTSAERTRIIDNASDFSMSNDSGLWGSTVERALMLKNQQRNRRKFEKLEKERHGGREKYVMSLNIGKNGKVTVSELENNTETTPASIADDLDQLSDEADIKDLKDIRKLQDDLNEQKNKQAMELENLKWNPDAYKLQFEDPVYITSDTTSNNNDEEKKGQQK
ncbi:hypothetical protein TPHA_0I00850 [Tetrapisispora phaffii CBS 4417]|uniref:TRIP4/RQT4 C2HC5-type zinc finger domain-containing protein n=1 Tax=Tetrapisispora phaffii (strain ATCC 24235 / CBS 4417 / NBRC 1672 / NRRL Y-8282 / UCD 70-5) TaxID=1071381 RepID=G8BXG3_TETPH|nr:hypothetical protein TPHA_0I00850 [Tetrapisispora phaffii CBS 4417]CCE64591.1 hypothetical protein TPHA_0I00850 [Tetrapisispora phaffii CBS 4417]